MSHFNKHYKTQSELIELGFTQEQIDNAKLSNMNLDIDEKCFELFDISILFRLIDNRIYKCYFINFKGEKITFSKWG